VLAAGTAGVAFFTWRTAQQAAKSRESEWQPYLVIEGLPLLGEAPTGPIHCQIRNLGRGPALRAVCLIGYQGGWVASTAVNVAHGESDPIRCESQGLIPELLAPLFQRGNLGRGQAPHVFMGIPVVICQDGMGNWLRFASGNVETYRRGRSPEWRTAMFALPENLMTPTPQPQMTLARQHRQPKATKPSESGRRPDH
jgi:hypothetical protein